MFRLNLVKGLGPALQIAEGQFVDLPREIYSVLEERTNPTWPSHWFVPNTGGTGVFRDVYSVMNAWGANHGTISYGHIGADLITLAAMLRIPVYMHNVSSRPGLPAFGLDRFWHRRSGRWRFPRVRQFRAALSQGLGPSLMKDFLPPRGFLLNPGGRVS